MGNSNTVSETLKKNQEYISDMNKIKVKACLFSFLYTGNKYIGCFTLHNTFIL